MFFPRLDDWRNKIGSSTLVRMRLPTFFFGTNRNSSLRFLQQAASWALAAVASTAASTVVSEDPAAGGIITVAGALEQTACLPLSHWENAKVLGARCNEDLLCFGQALTRDHEPGAGKRKGDLCRLDLAETSLAARNCCCCFLLLRRRCLPTSSFGSCSHARPPSMSRPLAARPRALHAR